MLVKYVVRNGTVEYPFVRNIIDDMLALNLIRYSSTEFGKEYNTRVYRASFDDRK